MAKENYLKFRCTDKMKSTVESKAKENNMSVSTYLESLIKNDINDMKIVYLDDIDLEIRQKIEKEGNCYLSSDKSWCLFTDIDIYNIYVSHYNIKGISIEEWMIITYDGITEKFIGKEIRYKDFIESTVLMLDEIEDKLHCDNWDETLLYYTKNNIVVGLGYDIQIALQQMENKGYDMTPIIKNLGK